ncbi:MAG: hypothetical protein ACTSWY_12015 [Promethearchaeota archaeon]
MVVPIILISIFTILTAFFDLKPLGSIIRQIAKQRDDEAVVVSQIIELTEKKKSFIFKFNISLYAILIVVGGILLTFGILLVMGENTFGLAENTFGLTENTIKWLGIIILIISAVVIIINGIANILLQLEIKKAKI